MTERALGTDFDATSDEFARDWSQRFLAAWNSHDPERLASLTTDDVRWEYPYIHASGVLHGKDELRAWFTSTRARSKQPDCRSRKSRWESVSKPPNRECRDCLSRTARSTTPRRTGACRRATPPPTWLV